MKTELQLAATGEPQEPVLIDIEQTDGGRSVKVPATPNAASFVTTPLACS
jgi:hypothetical protein